jgi:predicted RNA binding protein YcfA (HicA-like mRNA interferase family)
LTKLKIIDAKTAEKFLLSIGFKSVRQKGSHVFYRHPDGRTTTLPHHKGTMISRPLMREILREIEIKVDEYNKYLEKL